MSSLPGRHAPLARAGAEKRSGRQALDDYLSFWRYSRRAITLVWSTHRELTIALGLLTIAAGLMPAGIAYVGRDEDRARRGDLMTMGEIDGRPRTGGSSWQSLERGTGNIETDHLNGEIVLLGRLYGIPTPTNELLQRRAAKAARDRLPQGSVSADELLAELPPVD